MEQRNVISKYLLISICIFFLVTRLYKITEIPPSVYWDEASIGYNAYSILMTGKDEWGESFPIHFKAFGEYKLPVYIYSSIPFIAIFGLNEFSIRLSAILFSLGVVVLTYFLAKKIFGSITIALFSSFFVSISPWFFLFSRTGYEATAGLFFFMLGVLPWLYFSKNYIYLILSSLSFILSMYSYNSFRIIVPLTFIFLIFLIFKQYKLKVKNLVILFFVGFLFIMAIKPIAEIYTEGGGARLESIGIFDKHKRKIEVANNFIANYFSHLTPNFLLLQGDKNIRSQQTGFGQIYYLDVPFLLLGFYFLMRKKSLISFIPIWMIAISIIPSAITRESPHALRSIAVVPFISMISVFGVSTLYNITKKNRLNKYLYLLIISLFLSSFIFYYMNFIKNYNFWAASDWQYSYKKIFQDYKEEFDNFDQIVISDRYNQPYIFALFYLSYDPDIFRREAEYNQTIRKHTSRVRSFNNFIFTNVDYYNLPKGKSLIFSHPTDRITEITEREKILNPDGSIGIYVYEYQH